MLQPLFTSLSPVQQFEVGRKRKSSLIEPPCSHIVPNACLSNPQEEGKMTSHDLRKGLLKDLFDVASKPDTREANRRRLYAVWKEAVADDEGLSDHDLDAS